MSLYKYQSLAPPTTFIRLCIPDVELILIPSRVQSCQSFQTDKEGKGNRIHTLFACVYVHALHGRINRGQRSYDGRGGITLLLWGFGLGCLGF